MQAHGFEPQTSCTATNALDCSTIAVPNLIAFFVIVALSLYFFTHFSNIKQPSKIIFLVLITVKIQEMLSFSPYIVALFVIKLDFKIWIKEKSILQNLMAGPFVISKTILTFFWQTSIFVSGHLNTSTNNCQHCQILQPFKGKC